MAKKPNVSLRPVVEAIEGLLKELETLDEAKDLKSRHRTRALKASLEGTALMLQSQCWSSDANDAIYEFPA